MSLDLNVTILHTLPAGAFQKIKLLAHRKCVLSKYLAVPLGWKSRRAKYDPGFVMGLERISTRTGGRIWHNGNCGWEAFLGANFSTQPSPVFNGCFQPEPPPQRSGYSQFAMRTLA